MKNCELSGYYRYWLYRLPGAGSKTVRKLLEQFGNAKNIYEEFHQNKSSAMRFFTEAKRQEILAWIQTDAVRQEYERLKKSGIIFVTVEEQKYPARLREIPDAPYGIFYKGELPPEEKPSIAIIGARDCSEYGRVIAKKFAYCLAKSGVSIISGMARGIDSISQEEAIQAGGKTYAILGSGVDVCYPKTSASLYQKIWNGEGGIISLLPPGTLPEKYYFPERNRIVAGLADAILVIEARQRSGTWITVDMALQQGKDVYAVPGRITDRLSDGCNELIRQGAGIALTPEDLVKEMDLGCQTAAISQMQKERTGVMKFLDYEPLHVDVIFEKAKSENKSVTLAEVMQQLMELCLQGRVCQKGGCYFSLAE